MNKRRHLVARGMGAAIAVVLISNCGTNGGSVPVDEPGPYEVPAQFEKLSFRWAAADGIDLFTQEATVIRAAAESVRIALRTGDLADGYPGFAEALASPDVLDQVVEPSLRRSPSTHEYGTMFFQLLDMNSSPQGLTARIRWLDFSVADDRDGKYLSRSGGGSVNDIDIVGSAPAAGSVQESSGPRRAPLASVFGDWKITRYDLVPGTDPRPMFPHEADTWPTEPPYVDTPIYPTLKFSPGWPAGDST